MDKGKKEKAIMIGFGNKKAYRLGYWMVALGAVSASVGIAIVDITSRWYSPINEKGQLLVRGLDNLITGSIDCEEHIL